MMSLLSILKETEQKCQIAPLLVKAFQNYYHSYKDKQNVFDNIVTLFEVGRSIYCHLEEIVSIIMKDTEAHWNLDGNFIRKFFIATVALKNGFST
jgi:Iap family predicted aminopeptidase